MARFNDYATKFQTIRMERRDGILQMTFHTDGGPCSGDSCPTVSFRRPFATSEAIPRTRS
jgi:hypothetical protein